MFTGLIEEVGVIRSLYSSGSMTHIVIGCSKVNKDIAIGDSVAVNGACLTVTSASSSSLSFEAMNETIARTTLSEKRENDRVNLERALLLSSRLGGHLVLGHVDTVATISDMRDDGGARIYTFSIDRENGNLIVEKGSVSIDGVSLTVVAQNSDTFSVSVLPFTRKETIMEDYHVGTKVNVETDIIGKYVEALMNKEEKTSGITIDKLSQYGFLHR